MRFRRKPNPDFVDSLLDTMANVIGILVIVAALAQVSVGDQAVKDAIAAEAARADFPSISPEQLKQTREAATQLKQLLGGIPVWDAVKVEAPLSADEVPGLAKAFPSLKDRAARLTTALKGIREDRKQLAVLTKPAQVMVPDPRVPSKEQRPVEFICHEERIYPFHQADLMRRFGVAVFTAFPQMRGQPNFKEELLKLLNEEPNRKKLLDQLANSRIADEWVALDAACKLEAGKKSEYQLALTVQPLRPKQGETADDLKKPDSSYRKQLAALDADKVHLFYTVWGDSFEVFVEARRLAEDQRLITGWMPSLRGAPLTITFSRYGGSFEYEID